MVFDIAHILKRIFTCINIDINKVKNKNSVNAFYECRELTLNAFESGIFPLKEKKGKGLKILTPKQMLKRLPVAMAQVRAGNTSENVLNEIRQIIYSLCWANEITKKVYNNKTNSIKESYRTE